MAISQLIGKRIEIPTHYDAWYRGARFGEITLAASGPASWQSIYFMVKPLQPSAMSRKRLKLWKLDWDYANLLHNYEGDISHRGTVAAFLKASTALSASRSQHGRWWMRFSQHRKAENTMYFELQPAYGRDYKTKAEAVAAWESGKDFEGCYQLGFKPVNKLDIPKPSTVLLRYRRNTQVASVTVAKRTQLQA